MLPEKWLALRQQLRCGWLAGATLTGELHQTPAAVGLQKDRVLGLQKAGLRAGRAMLGRFSIGLPGEANRKPLAMK